MMSLIDLNDDQRWVPTHVNVTVLRARGLRTKGKHGSRYLYTIVQVGKEKYTTGLVERAAVPEWNEECCFELLPGILEEGGRSAYPYGSGDLVLTVMHRVLIGLDVFLGQASIPLDRIFHDGMCPRDEWMKLNSKAGRKEKERGEMQVTVQFTRNNMTASMFDLTMKDKPRSAFGKLKDRVTGRKPGDVESSSAILPGRYAALSGNLGQPSGKGGGVELGDAEVVEEKRSKVKDFFKGKLRRSSDTRSCSSLASESSMSSLASDNLGPPPSLDLLADPPSSPIYTSKVRVDTHYGETDLAKKVLTSQHTTKVLTHKRAFSDEASKITTSVARTPPAVEALKGRTMTQSKSSLCINGSHVYDSEPSTPRSSPGLPSKLVLLEKCSPLSRSLQNLTKRSDPASSPGEGRRWSFDKVKKEEREEEKEPEPAAAGAGLIQSARTGGRPTQTTTTAAIVSSAAVSPDKGKKQKKALFSGGRSDSLPAKSDQGQAGPAVEGRLRGWFGSTDTQNKPRLEVSPKVESSTDVPPPLPPRSPIPQQSQFPSPSASLTGLVSPDNGSPSSPFSALSSPSSSTPISTSNPFLTHMQRNPFFEELVAEELRRSPPLVPRSPSTSASSPNPDPSHDAKPKSSASARRERPRPVARQISLPALLPKSAMPCSPNHAAPRSMSETKEECDDFFDAFASSRLNSPKGPLPQKAFKAIPIQPHKGSKALLNTHSFHTIEEQKAGEVQPPPLPPRRLLRTPVNEVYTDTWLHRGQQLAVQHEACLLSQTGAASLQRGREGERKKNTPSISPDHLTTSETSDSLSVRTSPYENLTSPAFKSEETLKKFKYEPLEDEADRWRGMLFEQDLYGRVDMGNCSEHKVNSSLSGATPKEANHSEHNDWLGDKVCPDEEIIVDLLGNLTTTLTQKSNMMDIGDTSTILESTVYTSPVHQDRPPCTNDNISHSLTLEDLNMNVNDSDFTFIDSEGSSPSDIGDTVMNPKGLDTVFPEPPEDILLANYHVVMSIPDHTFSLNKTNTTQNNISLETPSTLSNELLMVFPVGEEEGCKFRNTTQNICEVGSLESLASAQADVESKQDTTNDALNNTLDEDLDGNGNLQASLATPNKKDLSSSSSSSSSRVVSARLRPNGLRGPANQSIQEEASERQLSREPSKSHQVIPLATEDMSDFNEMNIKSWTSSIADPNAMVITHTQQCTPEGTRSSFEDLHAKVAPDNIRHSSQESKPSPSLPSAAVSTPAGPPNTLTGASCLSIHPLRTSPSARSNSMLAVAPFTSSSSFSSPSTTVQPLIDAPHTLLPEEIDPACDLPRQESSPHPVKPLNSTASQSDKKEGRSVLEKLKSTIHPGRTASQSASEPERSQPVSVDTSAQYQQLSNMELIALLLQQEMDMQKQQAASEQQGALLDKREAELKKLKTQVRDLEDYIDNLLLRIMEQTPTLLQVRARHK